MTAEGKDTAAIGRAIYEEKIRHLVEPAEGLGLVVIDVDSGDYEFGDAADAAMVERLLARHPDASLGTSGWECRTLSREDLPFPIPGLTLWNFSRTLRIWGFTKSLTTSPTRI